MTIHEPHSAGESYRVSVRKGIGSVPSMNDRSIPSCAFVMDGLFTDASSRVTERFGTGDLRARRSHRRIRYINRFLIGRPGYIPHDVKNRERQLDRRRHRARLRCVVRGLTPYNSTLVTMNKRLQESGFV